MSERPVEIPVSKALRDKIKNLKGGLTYEEYLVNLINKKSEVVAHTTTQAKTSHLQKRGNLI